MKELSKSNPNKIVKDLINHIESNGIESSPRGLKVKELELAHLVFDSRFSLLDYEQRPFNYKYFMGELAWYLKKDRNIDYINHFSSFWKRIANETGEINSNYGNLLFGDQLHWAKESLLKDPNTRQAIAFVNRPDFQYEGNKDFVCTIYLNFWIRDNHLNMKVQMRSNDVFYGLTYDLPFFAFIHQTMYTWLRNEKYPDLLLGDYHHFADNIHYYEGFFNTADMIREEKVKDPIFFFIRTPLFEIKNKEMVLTQEGIDFLQDVENLIISGSITQENSRQTLLKYFFIQ
jgi:thymidylate synthase